MEGNERINQLLASLEQIHVKKEEDRRLLEEIKQALANNEIAEAMEKLQIFNERQEENEEIVKTIMNKGMEIVPIEFEGKETLPQLPTTIDGTLCICPTQEYEGFFIAKLRKIC